MYNDNSQTNQEIQRKVTNYKQQKEKRDYQYKSYLRKKYNEHLYAHKFDNLEEKDQFFKTHKLTKLTQGEIDNMNRPIAIFFNQ